MAYDKYRKDTTALVKATVPEGVDVTNVEFEGPFIVIYTKTLEKFADDGEITRRLAQALRRRVIVRPDPAELIEPSEAEAAIRKIVPAEAEITNIWFDPATGEVTIEAKAPGAAIGKQGETLNRIKKETRWAPDVQRTPSIPSKTVGEIRAYLRMSAEERKDILRKIGRRINREVGNGENWARMTTLGGFREVGRSCALLSTKDTKILIDCGVKFGGQDDATPYLNAPEALPLEQIDAVVLTHAHLDHTGIAPLLFKYGFEGAVYTTAPTRDTMSMLMIDYLKVAFGEARKAPYETSHIRKMVLHTIPLRWGETTDIAPDVRLTLQDAGHILGSSSCHFHVGDGLHNIVFSGDMKYEDTWLFLIRQQHGETYLCRSQRVSESDFLARIPELAGLRQCSVGIVGLGGIGAPSALEFARCQVGELRLLEYDFVEAGTLVRWPFGMSVAGYPKLHVVYNAIKRNHPYTRLQAFPGRIGMASRRRPDARPQHEVLSEFLDGLDLIYDATAEWGVQHLLSILASEWGIPQVYVSGTEGGWGGVVARCIPGQAGCWFCWKKHIEEGTIPAPPAQPNGLIQPRGCGTRTFTGAGFDLAPVVSQGVRVAVQTVLSSGSSRSDGTSYPPSDFDVSVLYLRERKGTTSGCPRWEHYQLPVHSECPHCRPA